MKLEQPYGSLEWLATAEIGNAAESSMSRMTLAPGAVSPLHIHSNCEEIAVIEKGTVTAIINDQAVELNAGQFVIAHRNEKHQFRNTSDSETQILLFYSSSQREYEPIEE